MNVCPAIDTEANPFLRNATTLLREASEDPYDPASHPMLQSHRHEPHDAPDHRHAHGLQHSNCD